MNKVLLSAIAIAIIILASYFLFKVPNTSAPTPTPTPIMIEQTSPGPTIEASITPQAIEHVVTYGNAGYSPKTITIKIGETITFKNESSRNVWTASALHPTHTTYSGTSTQQHCPDLSNTSFDQCTGSSAGDSWSFTFTKTGSWKYHNHLNSSDSGTVVVKP